MVVGVRLLIQELVPFCKVVSELNIFVIKLKDKGHQVITIAHTGPLDLSELKSKQCFGKSLQTM